MSLARDQRSSRNLYILQVGPGLPDPSFGTFPSGPRSSGG